MNNNGTVETRSTMKVTRPWYEDLFPGLFATLGDVVVGRVLVGPDQASYILERCNRGNRKKVDSQIRSLCKSLEMGDWRFNGETIVFDSEGSLRNGQHRMESVLKTGQEIETLAVFGVDPSSFTTFDQHTKRTSAQVLGIIGEINAALLASASVYVSNFFSVGCVCQTSGKPVNLHDQMRIIEQHHSLRASVSYISSHSKSNRLLVPSLAASLHYIFSRANRSLASEFFDHIYRYQFPANEPQWSGPALLLSRLVLNSQSKEKLPTKYISHLAVKAWNNCCRGTTIKTLRVSDSEEYPKVEGWIYQDGLPVRPASDF